MKRNYLKWSKTFLLTTAFLAGIGSAQSQTTTFNFTGAMQTFTVPCGVDTLFVQAWGAQGGSGATGGGAVAGGSGGLGGYAEGFLVVTPGDVLNIFVGGQGATPTGGFNGGANGGTQNAGGGGGATDIRVGGSAESNRVLTAGGGGGGGRGGCDEGAALTAGIGGNGGIGGGGVGANGNDSPTSGGAAGGGKGGNFGVVQGAAGPAGVGCGGFLGGPGLTASTGTGAVGGGGQSCCCSSGPSIPGGGGGGGGQIGGGGGGGGSAGTTACSGNSKGAGGGGGGGSSFIGGVINGAENNGIWLGNGQLTISWNPLVLDVPTLVSPDLSICEGVITTYTCTTDPDATSYTWTTTGGITIASGQGTPTITAGSFGAGGTISVTTSNVCVSDVTSAVETIVVNPSPVVGLSASQTGVVCGGQNITLVGSPAGGTFSQASGPALAVIGNQFNASQLGNYTVQYDFTDANGCSASAVLPFTVNCFVGIDEVDFDGQMNVYPNPTKGAFSITSKSEMNGTIELFDMTGQRIHSETVKNEIKKDLTLKNLAPGAYLLKITSDNVVYSGKLNIVD